MKKRKPSFRPQEKKASSFLKVALEGGLKSQGVKSREESFTLEGQDLRREKPGGEKKRGPRNQRKGGIGKLEGRE